MSADLTGVAGIQARIAELRARVPSGTTASSSASAGFATALAAELDTAAGTASGAAPGDGRVTGADLVAAARQYEGVPYVWGGESLGEGGLDCSGLVQRSLADLGLAGVPRTAREQATLGDEVASLVDARPGDLLIFGGGSHIGLYVGDGRMIDAPKPGRSVAVRDVYETPTTIRRILPASASFATASSPPAPLGSSSSTASAASILGLSSSTASLASLLGSSGSASTRVAATTADAQRSALSVLAGLSS